MRKPRTVSDIVKGLKRICSIEMGRCSLVESSAAILFFKSGGAARAKITIKAKIATSQIAILRVRGWRAIWLARPRSSVILAAIETKNLSKNYRSCEALSIGAAPSPLDDRNHVH